MVLFVDGYDVLLTPAVRELPRLFNEHFNHPVVFSTELACWPDAALCQALAVDEVDDHGVTKNLNSGAFAGSAHDLLEMLQGEGCGNGVNGNERHPSH